MDNHYQPPKIWTNDSQNGGKFASTNRPTAGATHEQHLPIGNNPLQLYSLNTPNGIKINMLLEEWQSSVLKAHSMTPTKSTS